MAARKLNSRISIKLAAALIFIVGYTAACDRPSTSSRDAEELAALEAVYHSCTLCHSTREMQRGPIIDGLPGWYVSSQVLKFQDGVRGTNPTNRSEQLMAAAVSDLDPTINLADLAQFIQEQHPSFSPITARGDVDRGKSIYAACIPCHGHRGEGNELLKAPPLAMIEDWYMLEQLRKFQTNQRGYDPRDVQGALMKATVAGLSREDFSDVTTYIVTTLRPKTETGDAE